MRRPLACLAILLFTLVNTSCLNILESFADPTTNEALFQDALKMINEENFEGALEKIALMTGTYVTDRRVVNLKAKAYAGICGLRLLPFVEALETLSPPAVRLFPLLARHFVGGRAAKIDACVEAEDLMESIGSSSERTTDENLLLSLISLGKVGAVLSLYTDQDQDGFASATADVCAYNAASRATTPQDGVFWEDDFRELGTGITIALANIGAVTSELDVGDSSFSAIDSACDDLALLNPAFDFCSITDPTAFTADHLRGLGSLLNESTTVGMGTTCTGDVATCACP